MTYYIKEIDDVREGDIPPKMYDAAIASMSNSILHSTISVFKGYHFFNLLSAPLKDKLVKAVLNTLFEKTIYFFMDFEE